VVLHEIEELFGLFFAELFSFGAASDYVQEEFQVVSGSLFAFDGREDDYFAEVVHLFVYKIFRQINRCKS